MRKIMLVAASIAASSFSFPAFAQDKDAFQGAWVSGLAGYDVFDGSDGEDGSEDGIAYAVSLGYDFNLGGLVVGAEAELGESSVSATTHDLLEDGDKMTVSAGRDIYAGIRLGMPVSETIMVYAKGGYTNQRFHGAYTLDGETEEEGDNVDGFRLGAGVELDLGAPFARLEYRYSDYGSFSDSDLETSRHQVMLAAGLRF